MRLTVIALLALLSTTGSASQQPNRLQVSADANALLDLTRQRYDANAANDRAFYDRLLAPAFLLLEPHRPAVNKQAYLDAEFPAQRPHRPTSTIREFQARIDGDTAVTSYVASEPYPLGGEQHFETRSRRLDTYVRIKGAWRLLSMAIAELPSWPDVATIDPKLLLEYAGVYEISARMTVTVTNDAGHLMAEVSGQPKVELFAENATTFFDRTDSPLARTVFERDESGRVVAQIYRSQGQTLRARKIK
jgi:hypothetical protein